MRPQKITRRHFLTKSGIVLGAAALAPILPEANLWRLGRGLWLPAAYASTVLDPQNPANFQREGTQGFTPGPVLTLADESVGDIIVFVAPDADAVAGVELDIVATFQVLSSIPNNADVGNRVAINDGTQTRAAIAACVIQNGVNGIGLLSQGSPSDPGSYPVFVPADWLAAPVTIRLRRAANGDAELVEVNGIPPTPRALLTSDKLASFTHSFACVEFGCASPEATCTVAYSAFRSERPVHFIPGALNVTTFRLRDPDSAVRFRGDFTLGSGNNGIDPATEPVSIALSTAAGQFYPSPAADFNPLNGFIPIRRGWTLNDAERSRSGIERLDIDLNSDGTGAVFLRDVGAALPTLDYSTVDVELLIGDDLLTGTVQLTEKPPGSGRWRFGG